MIKGFSIDFLSVLFGAAAVLLIAGIRAFIRHSGKSESRQAAQSEMTPGLPQTDVDPSVVAAIIAVISDLEKQPVRVHRIRYLTPSAANEAWQDLGRAQLLITRQVGRKA
ncbi:hypothetical protein EHM69_08060 [candidate division KSB1 bacterium]|nr:MAG: hypothetical protein EHM69_08060 [candidate division KSB1 bacterium]